MKKSDSNRGEERLTEVRGSRNYQKGEKEGSGRTAGGMDQQDGAGRAWRRNLGIGKWVTRPHASAHGTQAAREKRRVNDSFLTGFPSTCRSALCASEFEVSGQRRAGRKKSLPAAATEGSRRRIK